MFEVIRDSSISAPMRAALMRPLAESPQRRPVAEFLSGLLKKNQNPKEPPEVRAAAAAALGPLGLPESTTVLRPITTDPDPAIRLAARGALLTLGGSDVDRVALLGAILTDRDQPGSARAAAARQLAGLGDVRALPFLREVLGEELPPLPTPANPAELMKRANEIKAVVPIAAARAAVTVRIPQAFEHGLIGAAEQAVPGAELAIVELENFLMVLAAEDYRI